MALPRSILRAHGPMALERELVARLAAERDAVRADPSKLAAPLLVVVPSDGLRVHLTSLAARTVGALAGVRVVTLARAARDVLARAGQPDPRGADAATILVERAARAAFPAAGERFVPAAAASITDLLDAGLEVEHADAVLEALRAPEDGSSLAPRALAAATAVVRAALAARATIDAAGVARGGDVFARAARVLRADPARSGCRAVWIHGFADATGLQADFLAALVDARPAVVFCDDAAGAPRYGAALRARFAIPAPPPREPLATPPDHVRARGAEAAARETLRRVRARLDTGAVPERIAIVARAIAPLAADLRVAARRLSIPIFGDRARGPSTAAARRLRARLDVLLDPRGVALDRWFSAHEQRAADALVLAIGLGSVGAGRLGDLADLDVDAALAGRAHLRLPMRVASGDRPRARDDDADGANPPEVPNDDDVPDAASAAETSTRVLPRERLDAAVRDARDFLARTVDAASTAPAAEHGARVEDLLARWSCGPEDPLLVATRALVLDLSPAFRLSAAEFLAALERRAEARLEAPIGGRGGGVAVLDAAEARSRGFDHVFVLGLNAGVFPVAAREDALLRDDARARIAAVLPDLAPRRARVEEEAAVFAQLLASAPDVTLSWLVADDEDESLVPSPFLDAAGILHPERAPTCGLAGENGPRALVEHALDAARAGAADEAAAVVSLAIHAARSVHGLDPEPAGRIASARSAAARELDRPPGAPEPLGPFFGVVGAARLERRTKREIAVTTLENVARCPWQTFLARVLELAPPLDPLLDAPQLDGRIVGSVAHALLEETAPAGARRVTLEAVLDADGSAPAWAAPEALRAHARRHAARFLREEGRFTPGLDALVAARALELVAVARRLDAADPALRVVGAEVEGRLDLDDGRVLRFRADRAERAGLALRLVDWKSGRVFGDHARPQTRAGHARSALRRGDHLQAFAYALAAGEGRYVALHSDVSADDRRVFAQLSDDADLAGDFISARDALLSVWDAGAFVPRLLERDGQTENAACVHCELSAACVRGDSGARLRFAALVLRTDEPPAGTHEARVRRLLALRTPAPEPAPASEVGAAPAPKTASRVASKRAPKRAEEGA